MPQEQQLALVTGPITVAAELIVPLRPHEKERLEQCEDTIRRTLKTVFEGADALLVIHDEHLFRETHASFAAYCQDKWVLAARMRGACWARPSG